MEGSSSSAGSGSIASEPTERFREIRFRDLGDYKRMLRAAFGSGPAQETGVEAMLKSAHLYSIFFFLLNPLGRLGVLPTLIRRIFVCQRDGRAVAALCVRREGSGDGPLYLVQLAVDEAYRRQGIATRLLEHVESRMLDGEAGIILTLVLEDNTPQIRNRLQAGFSEHARQARFSLQIAGADAAPRTEDRDSSAGHDGAFCRPRRAEVNELRQRTAPAIVQEIMRQRRNGSAVLRFLSNVFPRQRKWTGGYRREGKLLAGGVLFYHWLHHSYELEIGAVDGAEDLARSIVSMAVADCDARGGDAISATSNDDQAEALTARGFQRTERRVLLCKRRPPGASVE